MCWAGRRPARTRTNWPSPEDGALAFASNYAGGKGGNSLSVIDIASRTERHHVELAPLARPHGLWVAGGKVYFTAEANLAIGRYDPAANKVDWILGTGQERTHMIVVSRDEKTIFTSNVSSDTISVLERVAREGPADRPQADSAARPQADDRTGRPWRTTSRRAERAGRAELAADDHPRGSGPRGLRRLARRQGTLDRPHA